MSQISAIDVSRRVSVAPMMDCTDRHFRYFLRLISHHVLLYSEMVTANALIYGDRKRFLQFDPAENPVAFQLGGSDPKQLGVCARMVEDSGYDEVNLNVGCPSTRVQNGRFGACLMVEPDLVARCIQEMMRMVSIPVSVKTRIGLDDQENYSILNTFVEKIADAGCKTIIVHARKALLNGLSPKQNRVVPPLRYDVVYELKSNFPDLSIVINGGITDLDEIVQHLTRVDGVMVGREAYKNPFFLSEVDRRFFRDEHPVPTRGNVFDAYSTYIQRQLKAGVRLHEMTRHIVGLFHSVPGARKWRRYLSDVTSKSGMSIIGLKDAAAQLSV